MQLYIGTSGFSYSYWKGRFYPQGVPASRWLAYYSTQFTSLELNSTFYRFPKPAHLAKMAAATPPDFRFSVKAHRIITHRLRMKDARQKVAEFSVLVEDGLGEKLACLLFQLPPGYSFSDERLADVLVTLAGRPPYTRVVEFRHVSWWQAGVYKALAEAGIVFCSVSFPGLPEDNITSASVFYKRMHGVPELFISPYSARQLRALAKAIPADGPSFIYFNNTMYEAGYTNARALAKLAANR